MNPVNRSWQSQLNSLTELGILQTIELFNLVRNSQPERVEYAYEVYFELKRISDISNPTDCFCQILKERWMDNGAVKIFNDPRKKTERNALFNLWFAYAKVAGIADQFEDSPTRGRLVFTEGASRKEKFIAVWGRGWTLRHMQPKYNIRKRKFTKYRE